MSVKRYLRKLKTNIWLRTLFYWVKTILGGITKRMIYTMSSKREQGEVWLADVLFKGTRQTKQRPVVIVGNELALDIDVIIAPVTSQKPRNQFDIDVEFSDEAGLLKPSVVRTSIINSIHGTELKRYLGELHSNDLANVLNMCRKLF